MGRDSTWFVFFILGMPCNARSLLTQVMVTVQQGLCPHTRSQYVRQFKLFLAFAIVQAFKTLDSTPTLMCFLQFLASNSLSFRVINNYLSTLKFYFARYQWNISVFEDSMVKKE